MCHISTLTAVENIIPRQYQPEPFFCKNDKSITVVLFTKK